LWVVFLDPSDSYFLFADLVGLYTHWTYMLIFRRIFLSNYWWQESDIWSQASCKQEVGIWRVQKHYPQYGIPIWCLWPNIRFLPSTVTEKNATKNILDGRMEGRTEVKQYTPLPLRGAGYKYILLLFRVVFSAPWYINYLQGFICFLLINTIILQTWFQLSKQFQRRMGVFGIGPIRNLNWLWHPWCLTSRIKKSFL
jgi:hypothetical protein